jgi:hypothetical protein
MAYVYRHVRLDKNIPFYIGVGISKNYARAYSAFGRSGWWNKVVIKTPYEVDILVDELTENEARIKEIEFISLYGRRDKNAGTLVNLTDGGDGGSGRVWSKEDREKSSKRQLGKVVSDETKRKLSIAFTGTKRTQEIKDKISKTLKIVRFVDYENLKEILHDYQNTKLTVKEIMNKYSIAKNTVSRLMKRNGIKLRCDGSKFISEQQLIDIRSTNISVQQIADHFNCSLANVEKFIKIHKVYKIK